MAYGTPNDPVAGTVITVAYAVANFLEPIRALRAFSGGADPPGTGYVVTSDSTSATTWKTMLAAIISAVGGTPVKTSGDTMTGNLTFTGNGIGVQLGGSSGANRGRLSDFGGTSTNLVAHNNELWIFGQDGVTILAKIKSTVAEFLAAISATAITGTGTVTGNRLAASISDGVTAPVSIHANQAAITNPNLRAASADVAALAADSNALGGVAPAGYAVSAHTHTLLNGFTWHAGLTAENTAGQSPTATYADLTSAAVTLDRAGTWLILAALTWTVGSGGPTGNFQIVVNGVAQTPDADVPGISGSPDQTITLFARVSASNGHVAKIQIKETGGGGFTQVRNGRIVAIWLAP